MSTNQSENLHKFQRCLAQRTCTNSEMKLLSTGIYPSHEQHPPWLDGDQAGKGLKICQSKLVIIKRKRETLNIAFVSIIIIISYLIYYLESNSSSNSRVFVGMVAANPAPEPAQIRSRSATSGSHRAPPINGSIFGKRSLGIHTNGKSNESIRKVPQLGNQISTYGTEGGQGLASKSDALNYKDIITQVIENFLALNNESDPDKASVAFCRMIVYECTQLLSSRSKSYGRKLTERNYSEKL